MLSIVLPDVINNNYAGSPIVIIVFGLLTFVSVIRSLIHIFKHDGGAQSIATIPLNKYSKPASDTIILIFAYWGISQLLMAIVYGLILWKYNSVLPLGCLLFTFEWTCRLFVPIATGKYSATDKTAPGAKGNVIFSIVGVILFYFSV